MFRGETYRVRREALIAQMLERGARGVVIVPGNTYSPNSYLANAYYFRQDATFRYLFGSDRADLWGVIDLDSQAQIMCGDDGSLSDIIWTGVLPSVCEIAEQVDIIDVLTLSQLQDYVTKIESQKRTIHILPQYRGETIIALSKLLNRSVDAVADLYSGEFIFSIAELRERKSEEEIEALEDAFKIGYKMHLKAMQMCREGVVEREIGGTLEGIARRDGAGVSFPPICTQHGETLHNISREGVLKSGRLMLCDAGAESLEGYCSDHTRTYPINGKFTDVQRDIYNVVLRTHENVTEIVRPNMLYTDLQHATYTSLAEGLRALGFVNGSDEDIVESGAMSLFMPHGVGHGLGLDVHDCEAFGERTMDLSRFGELYNCSTSCIVRSSWRFQEGTVLTNEPGIYFIPALIEQRRAEGLY